MAKHTQVRTFARTAAKSVEKKLIENAKRLMEDPYIILPKYSDSYSKKHFDKLKKKLDKVYKFKDDQKKLEKFSNKRGLEGAFAGTLLLGHSEKAPYLGVVKFKTGDVTYAQRGRADKEKLIAVQHFDDPVLRLLGVKDIALKRKLYIYSWDEHFVSTGLEADPPKEFIEFLINEVNLKHEGGVATCGDLDIESVKKGVSSKKNYLRIHWSSSDITFAICEDCAKSRKNTAFELTKYFLVPDVASDFLLSVVTKVAHTEDKMQDLSDYLSGELTDLDFIRKNVKFKEETLRGSKEKILVLNGTNYGKDVDGFIEALKPNAFEKEALEFVLNQVDEPVILDNVTPNKVLEGFWKQYGLKVITLIIDDEGMAKKFFLLEDSPSNILDLVYKYMERQQILSKLPKYKGLKSLAAFVDDVARAYKTFGEKEALAKIKARPDDPKGKSIAYAFLLVFGKASDKKWQYSHVEIEYGDFLKDYAKRLLDSEPNAYHKTFQELLAASGSSENIDNNIL